MFLDLDSAVLSLMKFTLPYVSFGVLDLWKLLSGVNDLCLFLRVFHSSCLFGDALSGLPGNCLLSLGLLRDLDLSKFLMFGGAVAAMFAWKLGCLL